MSKLFNVAENNITYHLQNIFKTGELEENRTTQKIRVVQKEGTRRVSRKVMFYVIKIRNNKGGLEIETRVNKNRVECNK